MNPAASLPIAGGSSHPSDPLGLKDEHPKGSWFQANPEPGSSENLRTRAKLGGSTPLRPSSIDEVPCRAPRGLDPLGPLSTDANNPLAEKTRGLFVFLIAGSPLMFRSINVKMPKAGKPN